MLSSRYVKDIGTAEPVSFGSNQGAVTGCVGNVQKGGMYVSPAFDTSIPMGSKGGLVGHQGASNCGVNSELNMGASKQHTYLSSSQSGGSGGNQGVILQGNIRYGFVDGNNNEDLGIFRGSYVPPTVSTVQTCHLSPEAQAQSQIGGGGGKKISKNICTINKLKSLKSYGQVRAFWNTICPGATSLYENFLANIANQHESKSQTQQTQQHIRKFLQFYTKAFCHEVIASKSNDRNIIKKQLKELESAFKQARVHLGYLMRLVKGDKNKSNIEKMHLNIVTLHKNRVIVYMNRARPSLSSLSSSSSMSGKRSSRRTHKNRNKNSRKSHKSHKSRKSHKKTHHYKNKKTIKNKNHKMSRKYRRRQRGGYHQFNSNIPITYGQEISASGTSNMNSPPSFIRTNTCVDNYNHYTGKGFETSVLDGDIV